MNQKGGFSVPVLFLIIGILVLYSLVNRTIWAYTDGMGFMELVWLVIQVGIVLILLIMLVKSRGSTNDKMFLSHKMETIMGSKQK